MKYELKMSGLLRVFLFALLIIVIGVVFYLDSFSLKYIRSGEIEKEDIFLSSMVKTWDKTLSNNKIFIDNYMLSNKNIAYLNSAKTFENTLYALQDIREDLNEYTALNYGMEEIFFYAENAGDVGYLASYRNASNRDEMMKYKIRELIDICEEHNNWGVWAIEQRNGRYFITYVIKRNKNYMGCWASLDYMMDDLSASNEKDDENYHIFLSNEEGVCLTNGYLERDTIDLSSAQYKDNETDTKYLQVIQSSNMMPIYMVEHLEYSSLEKGVIRIRNIMIIIGAALAISLVLWSGLLEYLFYRPIRKLMVTMTQISDGDLDVRIDEKNKLREIRLLYQSFNDMANEIQNLKIAIYEKEIDEQKAKLDYLQVQIHPHFLVNGLNSISAMIDMKKELPAKEMCSYLADYYRYQYSNGSGLIPLRSEIEHVNTYIEIQKMRHPNKVEFNCDIDENSLLTLIPPILILTFVENSFKYGLNLTNYKNIIHLKTAVADGMTQIEIRDEGPGFSDEVLALIESNEQIIQKERVCLGIQNAFKRLQLFYGKKATYQVFNDHGGVVIITIPTQME